MFYKIKTEPEARIDIQKGIEWYNNKQFRLGNEFHKEVKSCFKLLESNPFFQIRYKNIRCLPLNKFSYMIHFTVDEEKKMVTVRAVFHTSRSMKTWKGRVSY